jgi:NTE family protein
MRSPRPRVGLALSGGAVRGAAHVGVLEVLEREGFSADVVAGTSVGAIVGAAHAAGRGASEVGKLFRAASWPRLARVSLRSSPYSLLSVAPLERLVVDTLGIDRIEELGRPFAAVACDLLSGEKVVFRSGPLGHALRASSAVPGVFPPVRDGERLLVDGCVVDNLPVGVARELGAEYVIAVDIVPPPRGERPPRNVIEVLQVAGLLWSRATHPAPGAAECVIVPAVGDYLGWSFGDVDELAERGRAAAEAVLAQLRRDLTDAGTE